MKLSIAICEDDQKINSRLEEMLEGILETQNVKYEIDIFYSGEAFCKQLEQAHNYNLIFLDIEYGKEEINGVGVGQLIRNTYKNNSVSIVFISWERKYSLELHDIQPLNFLIKPLTYEAVEKVVKKYLDLAGLRSSYFTYKINHETYRTQVKDIAYVESADRKLILHLMNGEEVEFYGALKEAYAEQLQRFDFLLIHAAYAVNYDRIAHYSYETVRMEPDDVELSISQGKRSEVRKRFFEISSRKG